MTGDTVGDGSKVLKRSRSTIEIANVKEVAEVESIVGNAL